jgi:glucosamine--fructose-6-phosphate aminotransferase (isomerizing)
VDPALFAADLELKPEHLARLATWLEESDPWGLLPSASRLVLIGMGSSYYAASIAAARLRSHGVNAVAELASSDLLPQSDGHTVVVAVSAGGGSRETVEAVSAYTSRCPVVLLTNTSDSELHDAVHSVVPMLAGDEAGGVACRSFQHTLALLLALEARIVHPSRDIPGLIRAAGVASADLLARRDSWLPDVRRLLAGPDGTHVVAPARRLSSAQQSALMLREGPRVPAVGCETGDWSHVDVYLTRTTDYRMLLLAGSRWEDELLRWTAERGSTVVAVGADVEGAALSLRYEGDTDDDVRLLTETLVAELLAADLWLHPDA